VFDFKVCQKPDGKHYGVSDNDRCAPPAKEVSNRPGGGFLNLQAGKGINYDTAKGQGDAKTMAKAEKEYLKWRHLGDSHQQAKDKALRSFPGTWEDIMPKAKGMYERAQSKVKASNVLKQSNEPMVRPGAKTAVVSPTPKSGRSDYEAIVSDLQEARKGIIRSISREATWDSESDPRRLEAIREVKALMKPQVDEITKMAKFTPEQRRQAWEEISQGIESNL
jgi:hypothetical protein